MKNLKFTILFIISFNSFSQQFGNEWLNGYYGIDFMKVVVNVDGIYRISRNDFNNSGIITAGNVVNPSEIRVFWRGKEVAIKEVAGNDNSFDVGDYIEFYASKNDGDQDKELYLKNFERPHPYITLYADETTYFICIKPGTLGKRITNIVSTSNAVSVPNCLIDKVKIATRPSGVPYLHSMDIVETDYLNFNQESYMEPGEGMTGPRINKSGSYVDNITLDNLVGNTDVSIEAMVQSINPSTKTLNWTIAGEAGNTIISKFLPSKISLTKNNPTSPISFNIALSSSAVAVTDIFAMNYIKVTYQSNFAFINNLKFRLAPQSSNLSKLTFAGSMPTYMYDITDIYNQRNINMLGSDVYVDNTTTERTLFMANEIKVPFSISKINFTATNRADFNYLIITNPLLRVISGTTLTQDPINEYAAYRSSTAGGGYKPLIKEIQSLFDEYCYGERNPVAIKRYVDYMTENNNKIKSVFLIGNSYSYYRAIKRVDRLSWDLVPTFGYPGSDILLVSGLKGTSMHIPYVPIGRLAVITPQEVKNYLDKIIAHESLTDDIWQKNIVHFTGEKSNTEQVSMANLMSQLNTIAQQSSYGFNNATLFQKSATGVLLDPTKPQGIESDQYIDTAFFTKIDDGPLNDDPLKGASLITYIGHGNENYISNHIGYWNDTYTNLSNKGKLPFLYTNGCGVGDSFGSNRSSVLSTLNKLKDKGTIGGLSQSFFSYEDIDKLFMILFYKTYLTNTVTPSAKQSAINATNMLSYPIGEVIQQTYKNYVRDYSILLSNDVSGSPSHSANLDQTILHADPALKIFPLVTSLPLSLLNFEVKKQADENVQLIWSTEKESAVNEFQIERSTNGKTFKKIGTVKANNQLFEKNNYDFFDNDVNEGINYYRLVIYEQNGKKEYSKILTYTKESKDLILLDNPIINQEIKISVSNRLSGTLNFNNIDLFNMNGQKIETQIKTLNGVLSIKPVQKLDKGIYIISIYRNKGKLSKKVLIE